MSGGDLSAPLGALPPMKIHCAQLVESALRSALEPQPGAPEAAAAPAKIAAAAPSPASPTLRDSFRPREGAAGKPQIIFKKPSA